MKTEKYSPKWLLEKINASKTDAHKLMHIIEYRKEIVESTEKQFAIHSVVKSLPTKDEISASVFNKVYKGGLSLRNVFRDEINDAYYSGALDMHEELTK